MIECSCGDIYLNSKPTPRAPVGKNWEPKCKAHGEKSDWYLHKGGKDYFDAYAAYGRELQRLANLARSTGHSQMHLVPSPPRRENYIKDE